MRIAPQILCMVDVGGADPGTGSTPGVCWVTFVWRLIRCLVIRWLYVVNQSLIWKRYSNIILSYYPMPSFNAICYCFPCLHLNMNRRYSSTHPLTDTTWRTLVVGGKSRQVSPFTPVERRGPGPAWKNKSTPASLQAVLPLFTLKLISSKYPKNGFKHCCLSLQFNVVQQIFISCLSQLIKVFNKMRTTRSSSSSWWNLSKFVLLSETKAQLDQCVRFQEFLRRKTFSG